MRQASAVAMDRKRRSAANAVNAPRRSAKARRPAGRADATGTAAANVATAPARSPAANVSPEPSAVVLDAADAVPNTGGRSEKLRGLP